MSNGITPTKIHRIGPEQAEHVAKLATQTTKHLFGTKTIQEILTDSFLSLGLFDTDEILQACVCFAHFPNLATVPPSDWIYWVKSLYGLDFLTVYNTYWISFVVYHPYVIGEFLKVVLQAFFNWYDMVEWVLMIVPPNTKNLDFIECFGERIVPKDLDNTAKVFNLFLINKKTIMFDYRVRRAIDEDNDDLVELLPRKLYEYYGEYYVTELLTVKRSNHREIIVAELNHKIVGALITNSTVNCDVLNDEFELTVFNGLRKPHSNDMLEMDHQMVATGDPFRIDEEQEGSVDSAERSEDTSALSEMSPSMQHNTMESSDDFSLVDLSSITSVRYYEADYQNRRTVKSYSVLMTNESTLHPDWIMAQQPSLEKQITQGIQMEKFKPSPTFYGEINAFAIETITILPEYESSFYYLLHTIFECYPEFDYAILSMKHRHYVGNYILKNFVRVTPRPLSNFQHELYVANKYSLMNEILVTQWEIQEKSEILDILNDFNVKKMETQISNILSDLNEEFMVFLITCNDTMIGLVVIVESDDLFFLKTHYDLSIWLNSDRNQSIYGYIKLFLLSPIYHNHSQYILRELHRLTNYDYLFCRINYDTIRNITESSTFLPFTAMIINNIIGYMVPILPKLPQDYETNIINDYKISAVVSQKHGKLSDLFLSMPRITSLQRIEINHRIVVVGCGDVAIAFLKSLIYQQQQQQPKALFLYNNITLVCAHGFGRDDATNPIRQMMFIDNNNNDKNAYNLETFVNVVYGIMTGIDRKDQYMIVNNNNYVAYDHLVLLCGEQFQKPIGKQKTELPENIFIINTDVDATVALTTVKHLKFTLKPGQKHATEPKPILVYGHYLEALCCVAALLELGVPGKSIIYIDPGDNIITIPKQSHHREHYEYLTPFFNNDDCEIAIFNRMIIEGITVYQNFKFFDWNLNNEYNIVTSAKFQTEYKQLDLEFIVMFFYYQKSVSIKTFQAINNCGLVFDGHLVINKNNETSDPNISAAGSLTKYSKRYHCDHLNHRYFNSYEIGHNLGEQIKHKLIPAEYLPEVKKTKTTLKHPLIRHCQLPGDMNYLSVMKPGKPLALSCGKVIVTGSCGNLDTQGYFRLHLNRYNVVEGITCLSKEEFSAKNLIALYGKHEKFLNNLLWHYENGAITDLFQYFKQPWCYAIYNEDFAQLIEDFDELFAQLSDQMQLNEFEEIEQFCEKHGYFELIGKKLLEFLDERSDFLPMYATPNFVRMLKHDFKDNISAVDDD